MFAISHCLGGREEKKSLRVITDEVETIKSVDDDHDDDEEQNVNANQCSLRKQPNSG